MNNLSRAGRLSRRQFLKTAAVASSAAMVGSTSIMPMLRALASADLPTALKTAARTTDPIVHALNRTTFGPTPALIEKVRNQGFGAWLEDQMQPDQIDNLDGLRRLNNYVTLEDTAQDMAKKARDEDVVRKELVGATILQEIYSEAQLHEVMVNFWSEHFSVYHRKGNIEFFNTIHDREVIRKHAFGNFRTLLGATAQSPAMLIYLDNWQNHKANPNENYAREIMELHTLGIGNYQEADVRAVARALTGWTFMNKQGDPGYGEFRFLAGGHDNDAKTIFGMDFPAGGGINDGEKVLDYLASSPATAHRIAFKLCRRFISDTPPESIVKAAADIFLQSEGDIKDVLRTILTSAEFQDAPLKFKRPVEYFIGLCRQLRLDTQSPLRDGMIAFLYRMNQLPFNWVAPNGYSDEGSHWIGNLMERWTTAYRVALGRPDGTTVDLIAPALADGAQNTPEGLLAYWQKTLIGQPMTEAEATLVMNFFRRNGATDVNSPDGVIALGEAVALILASPAYQYR